MSRLLPLLKRRLASRRLLAVTSQTTACPQVRVRPVTAVLGNVPSEETVGRDSEQRLVDELEARHVVLLYTIVKILFAFIHMLPYITN